jgi:TPR repeat protein
LNIIVVSLGILTVGRPLSVLSQQPGSSASGNATTQAVALIASACDSGDFVSCRNLGLMYAGGRNVQRDDAKAVSLYQRACDGNNTTGCVDLGFMYESGRGVAKNESRAVELYQKTCTRDVFNGCTNLGLMYANGRGVSKDDNVAVALYQKACDAHFGVGCTNLGFMYDNGRGVTKDQARAAALFDTACDQGSAVACRNLGLAYANARGVVRDDQRAAMLYRRACNDALAAACTNLGYFYSAGRGVPKDSAQSVQLFQRACQGGDRLGCTELSAALANGKTLPDSVAASALGGAQAPAAAPPPVSMAPPTPPSSTMLEFGTAFAVSSSGLFMTAYHVVEGATDVVLRCAGGKTYPVTISAKAPLVDLAVLQTRDKITGQTFLPLAMEGSPSLGQHVFTIGYPAPTMLGAEPKYTEGTVSSLQGLKGDASFLQVSVPIQPGNSGGALLDERGRVIGVVVSAAAPAAFLQNTGTLPQNVNWAVKVALASPLLSAQVRDAREKGSTDREREIALAISASCLVAAARQAPASTPPRSSGQAAN